MTDATSSPPATPSAEGQESSGAQETVQQVAGQAQEKAQEAGAKAQDMLREQVDQRSTQAGEKVSGTAGDLRSVGEELRNQGKETPAKLADQAAERTEQLGSYLAESDADRILSDLEEFGRRRPWAVLAGGVVAGIAAARFLKASSQNRYQGRMRAEAPTRGVRSSTPPPPAVPPEVGVAPGAEGQVRVPADPVMGR
ncbi:MAG TPA: hypothetical protein VNO20_06195 [Solirubrobacterales bacterium]|nr:hypothetical protein [Solirubrobacterales bacterium]